MGKKRDTSKEQVKKNVNERNKQTRTDEDTIQSEKMRFKNADKIYE